MSYGFLKDQHREVLAGVADAMIPSWGGMPSATEAEVLTVWADEVLKLRQDLREPLFRAIRILKEAELLTPPERLGHLQQEDPEAFNALGVTLAGAYFLNPAVREKIGYPGQRPRVNYEAEEVPDYVRDGLLKPVMDRGPIYRTV
ncbi:MAG: hypothetical protein K6T30_06090 [Alicyclobacillus sp.]|nr:hypothetical protein [Alicyclobacillus sp.]